MVKIRNGFVSNSSTTSFVIVGVDVDSYRLDEKHSSIQELKAKILPEGKDVWDMYKDTYWGGSSELGDGLMGYGYENDILYVGIHALENWKNGMSYKEAFKRCKKIIKNKYDIDIPDEEFGVFYGEAGNG